MNPQLNQAAEWFADDVLANRNLDSGNGSDDSTVLDRARAAGYRSAVAEAVAIMSNCAYSEMRVSSGRRTVLTALWW